MKNPFERKDWLYLVAGVSIALSPIVAVSGYAVFATVAQMITTFVLIAIFYQLIALNKKFEREETERKKPMISQET